MPEMGLGGGDLYTWVQEEAERRLRDLCATLEVTDDVVRLSSARAAVADRYVYPAFDPGQAGRVGQEDLIAAIVRARDGAPVATLGARLFHQDGVMALLRSGRLWGGASMNATIEPLSPAMARVEDRIVYMGAMAVEPDWRGSRIGELMTHVVRASALGLWRPDAFFGLHRPERQDQGMVVGYFAYAETAWCGFPQYGKPGLPRHPVEIIGLIGATGALAKARAWVTAPG